MSFDVGMVSVTGVVSGVCLATTALRIAVEFVTTGPFD